MMKTVNALAIRKSLGRILHNLEKNHKPVLVTRDREPVAAMVPIAIFRQRFVDFLAGEALKQSLEELRSLQSLSTGTDSLVNLQHLREGLQ